MQTFTLSALSCLALAWACPAQQTWEVITTTNAPAARCGHAMAYDSARQRTVLFGGFTAATLPQNQFLGDTWEWDGTTWTQMTPKVAPAPREHHSMVFNARTGHVVLFGGYGPHKQGNDYFADTWIWDGVRWADVTPMLSPQPRSWSAMAYDPSNGTVALFGGFPAFADTWEWDGANWTDVTDQVAPVGRWGHDMAYDAMRQRIILFGGHTGAYARDTWEYQSKGSGGKGWLRIQTAHSPMACGRHKMAYDVDRKHTVMFGGLDGVNVADGTWCFENDDWTTGRIYGRPPARADYVMVYDSVRRRMVVFGGYGDTYLGDTWELGSGLLATFAEYGVACGSSNILTLKAETGSRPVLGSSFVLVAESVPPPKAAMALMFAGWSRSFLAGPGGIPLPMKLDPFGLPNCFLYQSLDFAFLLPMQQGRGVFPVQLPFDARLIGLELFFQAYDGSAASNGGAAKVGTH